MTRIWPYKCPQLFYSDVEEEEKRRRRKAAWDKRRKVWR